MALICLQAIRELELSDQIPHKIKADLFSIIIKFKAKNDIRL